MAKIKQRSRSKYDISGYNHSYTMMGKYSDESGDEIDLPIRKKSSPQQFIEAQIQDGDTLQAIALRFNCSVAKLMRSNNILRENEIFAKRTLKIPVTAFSLLTESIPTVHSSGTSSPTRAKQKETLSEKDVADSKDELQSKLMVASVSSTVIENLYPQAGPSTSYSDIPSNSEEAADHSSALLPKRQTDKSVEAVLINEFTTKGADLGMKWLHLLLCILVLCVVIPLVYVLYIAEHPEKYLHHQHP